MTTPAGGVAGHCMLDHVVRRQLDGLIGWAALPPPVARQTIAAFELLTDAAMQRPAVPPFDGLSQINANGLPFQWSFSFGAGIGRSLRFLCEAGRPGQSSQQRLAHARHCLAQALTALDIPQPGWLDACVFAHTMPSDQDWPAHWRSALWFGVGAAGAGVALKPYVNLNWGAPIERWRRLGRVLQALGRPGALATLCALSGQVSRDAWPVGLAVDVLPDGGCGRVKVYFRSAAVGADWLQRWYLATGAQQHAPMVRAALDAFPYCGQARYPERALIVSLELHGESAALKTDLAVTRWMDNDAAICAGSARVLRQLGGDPGELQTALDALGAWPPCETAARTLRFVGVGHEPDGSSHLNLYLEPPLPHAAAQPAPAVRRRDAAAAVRAGIAFLVDQQEQGMWRDYALPVGVADQWVTAYVLWMLARVPARLRDEPCRQAIGRACERLLQWGQAAGGWGYNASTGNDADSTSIAILALLAHGCRPPAQAFALLAGCQSAEGGIGTYPKGSSPGGAWAEACSEVSAVAWMALAHRRGGHDGEARARKMRAALAAYLAQARRADGLWPAYWWHTPLYPTFVALQAGGRWCADSAALRATLERFEPIGAFETALLEMCCQHLPGAGRSADLTLRLHTLQQFDGAWPAGAMLRLTDRDVRDPQGVIDAGPSFVDDRRVFTSATALAALARSPGLR